MFTGIIEELGKVVDFKRSARDGGARLTIRAAKAANGRLRLKEGESIAVNGVCLTARDIRAGKFSADLAPETLSRSNLGAIVKGSRVNLERAMMPTSRFSGHIVQGHVDGVGKLAALDPLSDGNYWLSIDVPGDLQLYLVMKGSVALNGISLTIARLENTGRDGGARLSVAIIPHTYEHTNLSDIRPGEMINVECDVLAKHVEKLLEARDLGQSGAPHRRKKSAALTLKQLVDQGF